MAPNYLIPVVVLVGVFIRDINAQPPITNTTR
jgi:hypothetical protein